MIYVHTWIEREELSKPCLCRLVDIVFKYLFDQLSPSPWEWEQREGEETAMSDKASLSGSSVGGLGVSNQKSKNKSPSRGRSGSRTTSQSPSPRSRSRSKSGAGSRVGSRNSSVGSKHSRGSRSFLGGGDYGGPVADGNIRILNNIQCGGEIFSLRQLSM